MQYCTVGTDVIMQIYPGTTVFLSGTSMAQHFVLDALPRPSATRQAGSKSLIPRIKISRSLLCLTGASASNALVLFFLLVGVFIDDRSNDRYEEHILLVYDVAFSVPAFVSISVRIKNKRNGLL